MKFLFTFILSILIWNFGFSQEFQKTDKFIVTIDEHTFDSVGLTPIPVNGDTTYIRLINSKSLKEIFKVPLYSEFYDGQDVEIAEIVNFESISFVVRLKTYYMTCCVDETSYYFLANQENNFIQLPEYTETFCDGPEPFMEYTFEQVENKKEQLIKLTHFFPNNESKIDSSKTLMTYRYVNSSLIKVK